MTDRDYVNVRQYRAVRAVSNGVDQRYAMELAMGQGGETAALADPRFSLERSLRSHLPGAGV